MSRKPQIAHATKSAAPAAVQTARVTSRDPSTKPTPVLMISETSTTKPAIRACRFNSGLWADHKRPAMTASRIPKSRKGWAAIGSKGKLRRFEENSGARKNALPKRNLETAINIINVRAIWAKEAAFSRNVSVWPWLCGWISPRGNSNRKMDALFSVLARSSVLICMYLDFLLYLAQSSARHLLVINRRLTGSSPIGRFTGSSSIYNFIGDLDFFFFLKRWRSQSHVRFYPLLMIPISLCRTWFIYRF